MEWLDDMSAAEWIAPTLHPWFSDLGMILPPVYEGYARIFHPLDPEEWGVRETWAEIAARNGRIAHADMQFHLIDTPLGETPADLHNQRGASSLPADQRAVVLEHLRPRTPADDVFIAVWHGYGDFQRPELATFELPSREYHLARGVLDEAVMPFGGFMPRRPANLWWPADRAWFVATEIDYTWTYVGGPSELVAGLVADERLEAWAVDISHRPFVDGDTLN